MKDDRLYLVHILECIDRISQYVAGGREVFLNDVKTQDAVMRNLHLLCESSQRISAELKAKHSEVDWRTIAGFRNVVVHDYLGIDLHRVWDIIERDLPDLKGKVETVLKELV